MKVFNTRFTAAYTINADLADKGVSFSKTRLVFSSVLIQSIRDGIKVCTVRTNSQRTNETLIARMNERQLVRFQTNWANDTFFGWGEILDVEVDLLVRDIVNDDLLIKTGCQQLTVHNYVDTYCGGDWDALVTKVSFRFHGSLAFQALGGDLPDDDKSLVLETPANRRSSTRVALRGKGKSGDKEAAERKEREKIERGNIERECVSLAQREVQERESVLSEVQVNLAKIVSANELRDNPDVKMLIQNALSKNMTQINSKMEERDRNLRTKFSHIEAAGKAMKDK